MHGQRNIKKYVLMVKLYAHLYLLISLFIQPLDRSFVLLLILVCLTVVIRTLCQLFSSQFVHLFTANPFIH